MRSSVLTAACLFAATLSTPSVSTAGKFNRVLSVGDKAPDFQKLKGVDGKRHSLADYGKAKLVVVVFICNHCPVAKAYQQRMIEFTRKYQPKGVRFVAISCSNFPADRFEKMQQRAKESKFNFPYLHDADQTVGKAYGATNTPQFFLLDAKRRIAYMGAFDDNREADQVEEHYLIDAVNALLAGKKPEITETRQFGCEIEYRSK